MPVEVFDPNDDPVSHLRMTPAAKQYFLNALTQDKTVVRLSIEGGGCSGFNYRFDLDVESNIQDDDFVYSLAKGKFVIDAISFGYVTGSTIDYIQDLSGSRPVINNPQAVGTCGCGESFSM